MDIVEKITQGFLLDKGIILQSDVISQDKINLITEAMIAPVLIAEFIGEY